MKNMLCLVILFAIAGFNSQVLAGTHGTNGKVTAKSIGAGALSLLIWPGIGQAVNNNRYEKNTTHALLGLTIVFRFWSGYDALVDRKGGVWKSRI